MPVLEPAPGIRVIAVPDALERARWMGDDVVVLRLAPDEALGLGATRVDVGDPFAIVEPEAGFVAARLSEVDVAAVRRHIDWPIPGDAGTLAQGKIAGVPAKLLGGNPVLLVTNAAYADELRRRLGW